MTDKQEKILQSALELFAKDGFAATSTRKVAKHAGVSEGLIFRHFQNKEGLLEAIIKEGEERIKILFANIVFEPDPRSLIRKTLGTMSPGTMSTEEIEFWKLQYKIKWELEQYGEHKMEPLQMALTNAFLMLGYKSPELEAQLLLINLDGLATRYFLMKEFDIETIITFLKEKYKV
ncbi:MAG: helix-turn-helix transcriptional regulator [Bacteroidia bacterium]|nr:helix-turn-helix transcriptional regulator [Bacteroidia bacterium]